MRRRRDRYKHCLRKSIEADKIATEADHQDDTQEGDRPGDDQVVDRLEDPCMIAMIIVTNIIL